MAAIGKSIPHLEDLCNKPEFVLSILKNINLGSYKATEKFDGLFVTIKHENGELTFITKSKTFTAESDFPYDILALRDLKEFYKRLKQIKFDSSFIISGEAIPNSDFNTIIYDKEKIGNGVFVILYPTIIDKTVFKALNKSGIRFFYASGIDLKPFQINEEINEIETLVSQNYKLLKSPARKPEDKNNKEIAKNNIKSNLLKAKIKMLESISSYYKPEFGKDLEGIVVSDNGEPVFKLVDKKKFTALNKQNWELLNLYNTASRTLTKEIKEVGVDIALEAFQARINELNAGFEQAIKDNLLEKRFIEQTEMAKAFCEATYENVSSAALVELGGALKPATSIVPKDSIQPVLTAVLAELGLDQKKTVSVGNNKKNFVGDIDIGVSKDHLLTVLDATEETIWDKLEEKLKTLGREYRIIKGLRQFHILCPLLDMEGKPIQGWSPKTLKRTEEQGMVQVDFLIGDLRWMAEILSAPSNTKYKSAVRNLFIKALCEAKNIINKQGSMEYSLNFRDGLWVKIFDLKAPTGRQKNVQKELVHKFLYTNEFHYDLEAFIFEKNKPNKVFVANTFEYWYDLMEERYYDEKPRQTKVLTIFKELCRQNNIRFPDVAQRNLDGIKKIALYPGSFKPFHKGHFEIVKQLLEESDEVKILMSIKDREDFSGLKAYHYMENWVIPFLGGKVSVHYTNNPILYAYKMAYDNKSEGNKTLLFVDKREFYTREQNSLFEYKTSNRLFGISGTSFREAIRDKNEEQIKRHLANNSFYQDNIKSLLSDSIPEDSIARYSLITESIEAAKNGKKRDRQA